MIRRLAAPLLALVAVLFFFTLWVLRGSSARVAGDEATYIAMAESLAFDLDLRFETADRERLAAASEVGRDAVILQRAGSRISYSKPILYPLLGAPFYRFFGSPGLVLLNVLCLGVALGLLARWIRRLEGGRDGLLTLAGFTGAGILLAYVPWKTGDLMQAAFAIGGLALTLDGIRDDRGPVRSGSAADSPGGGYAGPVIGAVLLGLLVSLRLTNGLVAAIPVAALLVVKRFRLAAIVAGVLVGAFLSCVAATTLLEGAPSPYRAVRATFNSEIGYPVGEEAERALPRFDFGRATYDSKKRLIESPLASVYSGVYFLVGRYTGLLLYFPMAFVLVGSALRRPDRVSWVVLGAVAALSVFYLVYLPFNYFGGATCIGNRYFLVSYAALPFALRRPVGGRWLGAVWVLSLVIAISALVSVVSTRDRDKTLLNHAHAGIFRTLPYESTAAGLAGGRDVFWKKEFGRFLDPYARVSQWKFVLDSSDPATELGLATRGDEGRLRFLVLSSAPELELVYSDWGRRVKVPLTRPLGKSGLVEIDPSRTLRRHPLWFRNRWDHGLPYQVRVFRLAVRSRADEPVEAEIRYLGQEPWPEESFGRQVVAAELPDSVAAGTQSPIAVRLRNTSAAAWSGTGPFPVYLSYRLTPLGDPGPAVEGPRAPIGNIGPGVTVTRRVSVAWPTRPGRYRLTVDLLIEGVSWFSERVGEPVAEREITVTQG